MALAITVPGNASDMVGVPGNNKYVINNPIKDKLFGINSAFPVTFSPFIRAQIICPV